MSGFAGRSSLLEGVEAVILDVGGVLILPRADILAAALAPFGVSPGRDELAAGHYRGARELDAHDDPEERWHRYRVATARAAGVPTPALPAAAEALAAVFGDRPDLWSQPRPSEVTALRWLADAGLRLAVVSNSDGTVADVLAALGVCQVGPGPGCPVEAIVDSALVGVAKPDPAVFEPALAALDLPPGRCLYVGDTVRYDVRGARAAGLRPVLLDPVGTRPDTDAPVIGTLRELVATDGLDRRPTPSGH